MCAAIGGLGGFGSLAGLPAGKKTVVAPPPPPPAPATKKPMGVMHVNPGAYPDATVGIKGTYSGPPLPDQTRYTQPVGEPRLITLPNTPSAPTPIAPAPVVGGAPTLGAGSPSAPGVMSVAGRSRKKGDRRLEALRHGITSTIRTSAAGVTGTVPFFAPVASAGGGTKAKLGQ